jgi:hypothetical protein
VEESLFVLHQTSPAKKCETTVYEVREKRGTYQVRKGETLIGRVLPAGDAYELSGVTLRLPHQLTQDLKQVFPQGSIPASAWTR